MTQANNVAIESSQINSSGVLQPAGGGTGVTTSTGSGSVVLSTSPTLVTPALGTPSSAVLTNATGLPIGGISATGTPSSTTYLRGDSTWSSITGMVYPGAGIANSTGSAWGTSYSTTGSGTVVALATSPTFVTPALGTPSSGTLTNCTGYTYANLSGTVPTWNQNTTGTAGGLTGTPNITVGTIGATSGTFSSTISASNFSGSSSGTNTGDQTNVSGTAGNITASSNTTLTSLANLATVGTITSGTWSGSFGAVSGANLTTLNASNLSSGTVGTARLPAGTIKQVISTTTTSAFTTTNNISSPAQITGLTATITPTSSSSQVLVIVQLAAATTQGVNHAGAILYRGGSATNGRIGNIYQGDSGTVVNYVISFLDSPATTSATTYSVYYGNDGSGTIYINRSNNGAAATTPSSSITVMEVAA